MARFPAAILIGLALVAPCATALAQPGISGTITDRNAVFTLSQYTGGVNGNGPSAFFSGSGPTGPTFLTEAWWWARVEGSDVREFAIYRPSATLTMPTADHMQIVYQYAGSVPLRVTVEFQVASLGQDSARLTQSITVQNLSTTTTLPLNIFNFNRMAVWGTAGNDIAIQTGTTSYAFVDGIEPLAHSSYQVGSPSTTDVGINLRARLTDSLIDNMAGGVIESGPAALDAATQFSYGLGPLQSRTSTVTLTVAPAPGALALLALGTVMIARRKR